MSQNDFEAPDARKLRAQRAFAALQRISERHADTSKRRARAWNPTMVSPIEAVRLVTMLDNAATPPTGRERRTDRDDVVAALTLTAEAHADLDSCEATLISAARTRGLSWSEIAFALGLGSAQAAQKRFQRVSRVDPEAP